VSMRLTQDSTARTWTSPSGTRFNGGTDYVVSTGSGAVDWITYTTLDGGTTWDLFIGGQAMAT
jgi:hypothetical protein